MHNTEGAIISCCEYYRVVVWLKAELDVVHCNEREYTHDDVIMILTGIMSK